MAEAERILFRRIEVRMARALYDKVGKVRQATQDAGRKTGQFALEAARRFSSGPYTTAQLVAMKHPYARRLPRPPLPPEVINRQSGDFYRGWRLTGEATLTNTSRHAIYLFTGTRRMIRRPILEKIASEVKGQRHTLYKAAIVKALRS